jgi:hypothetical protein
MNKAKVYPWIFAVIFGVVGFVIGGILTEWQVELKAIIGGIIISLAIVISVVLIAENLEKCKLDELVGFGAALLLVTVLTLMNSPFSLAFFCSFGLGLIGYKIGTSTGEWAEIKVEIKIQEKLERDRIRKDEERRRLEYEREISGYRAKIQQWESEGYDVSKLKKRWFK